MQRNVDGQTRSASRVLPRQKRRDDAPSSFPPADRLVAACSFPVLPSLALNLKGANAAAASTHVQVPQTLATRPQTLSHYDQLNQLQEAMRDKLRSETAALKEQLALARELRRVREQDTRKGAQISKNRQAAALLGGARSVGELRSGALPATPRGAASAAGGGGPAPRMAWSRTQKYLSPQQGLGGGANQGTTPRGDGRAGGGRGE